MANDEDDWQTKLEEQPVFILSQMQAGRTLTEDDVAAIQAVLKEIDDRENADVNEFHNGRIAAFHEIGGQELADAVQGKFDAFITKSVRKVIDDWNIKRGIPTERDEFRDVVAAALDEWEGMNGQITDPNDPHWSNKARQMMKDTEPT